MKKHVWYIVLLFFTIMLFLIGCASEQGKWFHYARKYDQTRNKMIARAATGNFLSDYNETNKIRQKFLNARQPTEAEIITALNSSNRKFQRIGLAAMSLKPIETDQIVEILFEFLQDENFYFKEYALLALKEFEKFPESKKDVLGKQLLEIIKGEEKKGKEGISFREFSLLAKFPSQDSVSFLTERLMREGAENKLFRIAAFSALKKMGEPYYSQATEYVKKHGNSEIKNELLERENTWLEGKSGDATLIID